MAREQLWNENVNHIVIYWT